MSDNTLITLEQWGKLQYGDNIPHMNTLRRWVANGNIYPRPRKHGRAYMVHPAAVYVDPTDPQSLLEAREEQHGASALAKA
jgi:prophage antirepressor-like protein